MTGHRSKRPPAEWALRWVWNHPEVTVVLSGMNEETHIAENLATCRTAFPGAMSEAELATISEVAGTYRGLVKVGCTGCAYCMPCPFGVNIPMCFSIYNDYHIGASRIFTRGMYGAMLMGGLMTERADASLCRDCGRCTEACPQKIAIPSELKSVNRTLGGLRTKLLMPVVRMMFTSEVKE